MSIHDFTRINQKCDRYELINIELQFIKKKLEKKKNKIRKLNLKIKYYEIDLTKFSKKLTAKDELISYLELENKNIKLKYYRLKNILIIIFILFINLIKIFWNS